VSTIGAAHLAKSQIGMRRVRVTCLHLQRTVLSDQRLRDGKNKPETKIEPEMQKIAA